MLGGCGEELYNNCMDGGKKDTAELDKFVTRLKTDFVQLRFLDGKRFTFRPKRTIILEPVADYADRCEQYKLSALHELGHALLEHNFYTTDPERLRMESEAWKKAKDLCLQYGVKFDSEYVENELDTYRDWLHRKSCCPRCGLTRFQTRDGEYHCPGCDGSLN